MPVTPQQRLIHAPAASTPDTALLSVRAISKRFGNTEVLKDVDLEIAGGEFLTILGESGSGKTTLLRMIAGFEKPDSGQIWMSGERIDILPPYRRRVNTVFQQYALFPHLSVRDNVAYGLRVSGVTKDEIAERVAQALEMVRMSAQAKAMPSRISGGQQQRVALARALVNRPKMLLLDEPLSALDANLRVQMQQELKQLQREVGIAFVFVTHDQHEAMAISDRIVLLREGRVEQVAPPREIYCHPSSSYVARFLGQSNLLPAKVHSGLADCGAFTIPCPRPDGRILVSLRAECIRVPEQTHSSQHPVRFHATVARRTFHGAFELLTLHCGSATVLNAAINRSLPEGGCSEFEFDLSDVTFLSEER